MTLSRIFPVGKALQGCVEITTLASNERVPHYHERRNPRHSLIMRQELLSSRAEKLCSAHHTPAFSYRQNIKLFFNSFASVAILEVALNMCALFVKYFHNEKRQQKGENFAAPTEFSPDKSCTLIAL
jgi:hypothetical protein